MEELLELLNDIKEDVDFENEKALVDDHILDSFDILQIISDISDEFDIVIPAAYVKPENFNSAEALWKICETAGNSEKGMCDQRWYVPFFL